MAKITGVGGGFFKSNGDHAALAAWYQKHLGMPLEDVGGAILRWPDDEAEDRGLTVWIMDPDDNRSSSGSRSSGTTRTKVPATNLFCYRGEDAC